MEKIILNPIMNKVLNKDYILLFIKEIFKMKSLNIKELIKNILIELNNFDINNKEDYIKRFEYNIINLDKLYSLCYYYVSNNIINTKYNYNDILNIIENFYNIIYHNEIIYNILSNIIKEKTNNKIINKIYNKCKKYNEENKEELQQLIDLTKLNKEKLLELKTKEFKIYLPQQIKDELQDTPFNNLIYENYIYLTIDNYFNLIKILNPLYNKKIISEFFKQINPYILNYIYYHINKYVYLTKINSNYKKINNKNLILCGTLFNKLKNIISEDYNKLEYYCKLNNINFENIKYEEISYYVNIIKELNYKQLKLLDLKILNEKDLFNLTLQKIIQYLSTIFNLKLSKKIINNNYYYIMKNNKVLIELLIIFNDDKFKLINIIDNVNIIYIPKLNISNILDYILPFSSYIGEIIYSGLNNKYDENYKFYNMVFNKFCEIVIFKNIKLIFPKEYLNIKQYYTSLLSLYYYTILFESLFTFYLYNNMDLVINFLKNVQNKDNIIDEEKDNILIKYITELYNTYYKKIALVLDKYNIFNTILYFDINYFKLINVDILACTLYKDFEYKLNIKKKENDKLDSSIYNVFNIDDIDVNKVLDNCKKPFIDDLIYIYFDDIKINNILKEDEINNEIINEEDNDILLTETAYNIQKVLVIGDKIYKNDFLIIILLIKNILF